MLGNSTLIVLFSVAARLLVFPATMVERLLVFKAVTELGREDASRAT